MSFSDIQGGAVGTGNLNVDPWFVDPPGGDFSLLAVGGLPVGRSSFVQLRLGVKARLVVHAGELPQFNSVPALLA